VGSRPLFVSKGSFGVRENEVGDLVRPVVEAAGLELWEVSFGREDGRRILRVTVDRAGGDREAGAEREGGGEKKGGVDLDTIAATSQRLSRRLDLEGFEQDRPYELQVSSPGLERPLREPRHFERSVGQQVRVKTVEPVSGRRVHEGALVSADAEAIVIASEGGELRVPYGGIASARTVFEWKKAGSKT
jgi:ribosome maturation factor RimP